MWIFHQSTGCLEHNGVSVATGYSGARSLGINLHEAVPYFGSIPKGLYAIGWSFSKKRRYCVLSRKPIGHDAHGRTSFLIHGDYLDEKKRGTASEGCINLPLDVRQRIWNSRDRELSVQL
jgi:hypothetical protein